MTAIISICSAEAVYLLADSAATLDGILVKRVEKIVLFPERRMAFSLRGAAAMIDPVAELLRDLPGSFDEIRSEAPGRIRALLREWEGYLATINAPTIIDVVVAGISESRGPMAWFLTSHDGHGVAPWATVDLDEICLLPSIADARAVVGGKTEIDPETDGLALMEAQRREMLGDRAAPYVAGGSVQLVSISRRGVANRMIAEWPDEIGQPVGGGKAIRSEAHAAA